MPYDDPDPTDPSMLIGVEVPAVEGSDLEMAYVYAEEFARLGFSERQLLSLFRQPFYAGAHRALETLGEEKIKSIIREAIEVWGNLRFVVQDAPKRERLDVPLDSLRFSGNSQPREREKEVDDESSA